MSTFSTIKAAVLDLTIKRGDTQEIILAFTDPDDSNNPVDLSVYNEIKMQIKKTSNGAAELELTLISGLTVSGVDNNILTIDITSTQAELVAGPYKYDIEGTITADDFVRTLVGGSFVLSQDITNA